MKPKKIELPQTEDFQNLIDLLAVYTEASNRLAQLQADANDQLSDILDEIKSEYTKAQEAATRAEAAMEHIVLQHPEWFTDKRSIKTPWGTVSLRKGTKLDASNEEASIVRIRLLAAQQWPGKDPNDLMARAEFISRFVRTREELNLEALETESDTFLKTIGVTKVPTESFSAKPATLDLGKAVKETETATA